VAADGVVVGWRPVADEDGTARYGWRLIGANNRELGRGLATFSGLREARLAAGAVRQRSAELREQMDNDPDNGSWGWRASLDGAVAAMSGRRYQRMRECSYNFQQFVVGLATAVENLSPTSPQRIRVRRYVSTPISGYDRRPVPSQPAAPQ
jgi:hypothetical protein